MEEENIIVEVSETPSRSPGDGVPPGSQATGESSAVEGVAAHEKEQDGPWNEFDTIKGHLIALQSGFMSDLTITVQEEKFRCHAYFLGMASPKLAEMITTNKHKLKLTGVTSTNFRILLEIMYSGAASELQTDLIKTLHIRRDANELQVYKAVAYCSKLFRELLDGQNVCSVLDEACLINDTEMEACTKVIQEQTDRVLKSDSFLKCNVATLELILKQEAVHNVTELEIYLAFTCWLMTKEQTRQDLGTALSLIRFQVIQPVVVSTYLTTLMTNVEKQKELQCFAAEGEGKMPEPVEFSKKMCKRRTTWSVERHVRPGMEEIISMNMEGGHFHRTREQQLASLPLSISVNEDVFLIGVIAYSYRGNMSVRSTKYTEGANLSLKSEKGELISTATFSDELTFASEYHVKFPQPVVLYAEVIYTLHFSNSAPGVHHFTRNILKQTRKIVNSANILVLEAVESPISKILIAPVF